ncbi:MAG: hypothetical protein KA766_01120 [Piscinibacter sp.]|uniref:hypothetical protein n=1 Tax=Piscinibacter sp. TaxID=1903157 RepID=UPI001B468529|nr:hypothetical protein [Piscinibacter sp.]MBP5988601.1 hypothetical protein [Piscinibacter sp.]MBP6025910.1 hypothetical protein [Piscinibacter sp.]
MRTTVTLDAEVQRLLQDAEHGIERPSKQRLDDAARAGLGCAAVEVPPFRQPVFSLGRTQVDLTKAGSLTDE